MGRQKYGNSNLELLAKLEKDYEVLKSSLNRNELQKIEKFLLGLELRLLGYSNRFAAKLSGVSPNSLEEVFNLFLLEKSLKAILRKRGRTPKSWEKEAYKLKKVNPELYKRLLNDLTTYTIEERKGIVKLASLRQIYLKYKDALAKEGFSMNKDTFKKFVEGIYLLEFGGWENMISRILPKPIYDKIQKGEWKISRYFAKHQSKTQTPP